MNIEEMRNLQALVELSNSTTLRHEGQPDALRAFEDACNWVALTFDLGSPQRRIALKARGDMREANGEGRT